MLRAGLLHVHLLLLDNIGHVVNASQLCRHFASLPPAERNIHFKSCIHLAMKRLPTKVMIIIASLFCHFLDLIALYYCWLFPKLPFTAGVE